MEARIKRIQDLFKARFGLPLPETEIYGYLRPRLVKQMDTFLDLEISDIETIQLADFISEKLHGKSILTPTDVKSKKKTKAA